MDPQQATFAEFEVPDAGRIRKVHRWLTGHGFLDAEERPRAVLEIGYARGGLLDLLDPADRYERVALDVHQRQVEPGITFIRHDCNDDFDFADGRTFDVVFAGEVIEHIFDDGRFLEQVRGILAPGGILALTTPNLFFLPSRLAFPFGRMPFFASAPYHYHYYSRRTLTDLLTERGYDVRHVTSSHILVSTRRHKLLGALCERLGDAFPTFGAHLIAFATKKI